MVGPDEKVMKLTLFLRSIRRSSYLMFISLEILLIITFWERESDVSLKPNEQR